MAIYIVRFKEFEDNPIYKIGMTTVSLENRIKQYPKNSELIFTIPFNEPEIVEKVLLNIFRLNFIQHIEIGNETFEGDINKMINIVVDYYKILQYTEINNINNLEDNEKNIINKFDDVNGCCYNYMFDGKIRKNCSKLRENVKIDDICINYFCKIHALDLNKNPDRYAKISNKIDEYYNKLERQKEKDEDKDTINLTKNDVKEKDEQKDNIIDLTKDQQKDVEFVDLTKDGQKYYVKEKDDVKEKYDVKEKDEEKNIIDLTKDKENKNIVNLCDINDDFLQKELNDILGEYTHKDEILILLQIFKIIPNYKNIKKESLEQLYNKIYSKVNKNSNKDYYYNHFSNIEKNYTKIIEILNNKEINLSGKLSSTILKLYTITFMKELGIVYYKKMGIYYKDTDEYYEFENLSYFNKLIVIIKILKDSSIKI